MKLRDLPSADFDFGYKEPPRSGNAINGLGEQTRRRAERVFHCLGRDDYHWAAMNVFFYMVSPFGFLLRAMRNRWIYRNSNGPVAKTRQPVDDPAAMAAHIKEKAREFGAALVGVTEIIPGDLYHDVEIPYTHAVCIGFPMNREKMVNAPHREAGYEVMRVYGEVAKVAVRLAAHIRSLGWPAYAYSDAGSTDILQIPMAVRAGIGELGKHGSIICEEFGSNYRLSSVATTLPMALDRPIDIGVDDLCMGCRRCTTDCPPGAISDTKQWVRGDKKWYVDFDKCVPYFSLTQGCAICIEVCPWSEPGRGAMLSRKLLAKRRARREAAAAE